ncbi:MAG: alkane 1-monooxygenase [Rhizomicrobium sp.]
MFVYLGPFIVLGTVPAFCAVFGGAGSLLTVALLLLFLIGFEALSPHGPAPLPRGAMYRLLPVIYVPLQLLAILWAIDAASRATELGFVSLMLAIGVTTGVFGMLCAHELVHSRSRFGRALGAAMLTGMCYRHFRVAHIHGHHRHAGTRRDSATARLGESFYAFLVRTVPGQFREAWRHERMRAARRGLFANRMLADAVLMTGMGGFIAALWGWRGIVFFAGQSAVGVIVLELFNYVAHYGLARGPGESFAMHHSWNSSNVLANTLIFNMGRHSDHHRRPAAAYHELRHERDAPELPAGYAGSILLALIPPLWRRVMDPAVARAISIV